MQYVSSKLICAEPMSRGAYNEQRGWTLPEDEDPDDPGYMVTYPDGYVSWCPKAQFESSSRPVTGMPFGHAIEAMRKGAVVSRKQPDWRDRCVCMMDGLNLEPSTSGIPRATRVNGRTAKLVGSDTPLDVLPYFVRCSCDGDEWQPGWAPTQADMLADDWHVVDWSD